MKTIKTHCPLCGEIELPPSKFKLVICSVAERSYYSFTCLTCRDEIRKPADGEVITLLTGAGVPYEDWQIPAEAMEEHIGTKISADDVLDFMLLLDTVMAPTTLILPLRRPVIHE